MSDLDKGQTIAARVLDQRNSGTVSAVLRFREVKNHELPKKKPSDLLRLINAPIQKRGYYETNCRELTSIWLFLQ